MDNSTPRLRRAGAQVGLILLLAALAESASAHPRYTVQWGDTLTGIASRHGTSVSALARLNGLDPTNLLLSGTSLRLPSSGADAAGTHVVRAGETLSGIAARYGTSVAALVQANGLASANLILAGAPLRIPGSSPQSELAGAGPKSAWGITAAIDFWSGEYGVDPRLSRALAWMESGFQTNVTSTASAWGVMQVTPDAWVFVEEVLLGARVPHTAEGNVRVGVAYLGHLLRQVGGNERRALAAYYQGLRSVRTEGLFPETRNYVADVLALKGRV
jgi:N-acetylmuramoyl-L-alanine amidase